MQMSLDALRRKSNVSIKELEKENASYAAVTQKATAQAATAFASLQDALAKLRTTKTQLAQANDSLQHAVTERDRLGLLEQEERHELLATGSERDHLRLLLQTQADSTKQLGAVQDLLSSQRKARKQDAKELELLHSRLKGLGKVQEQERALLACVRQLVLSNKAMEASLSCMACMQLMPEVCQYYLVSFAP